jgi:hypothetical protein
MVAKQDEGRRCDLLASVSPDPPLRWLQSIYQFYRWPRTIRDSYGLVEKQTLKLLHALRAVHAHRPESEASIYVNGDTNGQ